MINKILDIKNHSYLRITHLLIYFNLEIKISIGGFGSAMVSMLNCCAQDRGFKPGRSLRIFYER